MRLLAFLMAWDLLRDELGRRPSILDYERRFGLSPVAAQRDRELFEAAFPCREPDQILDSLWAWHASRGTRSGAT